jgi:hypothetical protein
MTEEIDTKLNPSVTSNPSIVKAPTPGGIKTGFLYAFILTVGIGSF